MTLKTNTTFKTLPAIYDEGIAIHVNIKNSQDSVESCEFFCGMIAFLRAQWKFSGDKHKSLQVYTERTFHQRYLLVML